MSSKTTKEEAQAIELDAWIGRWLGDTPSYSSIPNDPDGMGFDELVRVEHWPPYLTDWGQAGRVIEKMRAEGWDSHIDWHSPGSRYENPQAVFAKGDNIIWATENIPATAICQAARAAVEANRG